MITGGLLIIGVMLIEVLWSTISTKGGGPISMNVAVGLWKLARLLFKRFGYHRLLETNAVVILVVTFLVWVIPMWLGWTMVFSSAEEIVIYQLSEEPAALADRAYFAGMVFLTLGTGDVMATGATWRLLSLLASLNGLVVITLTITYLVSVLSSVIRKRQLAIEISGLGSSAREILENGWDGTGFEALEDQLQSIASQLIIHAEQHLAYPVLQYFHSRDRQAALALALARLDDATTLMSHCVQPEFRPNKTTLRSLRRAIDVYIRRVQLEHITSVDKPPPIPDVEPMRRLEMPMSSFQDCREAFASRTDLRTTLLGLVEAEGWEWPTTTD